jgi:ferredoxin/flavodoxin
MNITHLFFSPNGESRKIAQHFQNQLGGLLFDLTHLKTRQNFNLEKTYELIILTIPVYAQQIPIPLRTFISKLKTKYLIINLTYGGFSYGNVLYDVFKRTKNAHLLGYSITPVKHAYIEGKIDIDFNAYHQLIERIQNETLTPVSLKYRFKNVFARVFEKTRTHYNFKLTLNKAYCHECQQCINACPVNAIRSDYRIDLKKCIACGRCTSCPNQAFKSNYSKALRWYLKRKRKTKIIVKAN